MQPLSDRQQQIYELLQTRLRISTEEIRAHYDISPATASRDIHALVLAGLATKASLGVKLAPAVE
jgi:DeoR/GlpR family transcriptional regulator of sugar metabolism